MHLEVTNLERYFGEKYRIYVLNFIDPSLEIKKASIDISFLLNQNPICLTSLADLLYHGVSPLAFVVPVPVTNLVFLVVEASWAVVPTVDCIFRHINSNQIAASQLTARLASDGMTILTFTWTIFRGNPELFYSCFASKVTGFTIGVTHELRVT